MGFGEDSMSDRLVEYITADRIARRIAEMGVEITKAYHGRQLLIVCVLKGAVVFLSDLIRQLGNLTVEIDFLGVASYGSATESSGVVEIRKDLGVSVMGRDVLIVEDIVDTGLTLDFLKRHIEAGKPKSVRICALLDKPSRRQVPLEADFLGFKIDDAFVVGYGLDYNERYRELPSVHILRQAGSE